MDGKPTLVRSSSSRFNFCFWSSMEGQITVDYSCLEQASEDGTFFTRKLQCPVVFTVHRAIDVSSLSFQPLQALQPASDLSQLSSPSTQRTRSQSVSQLESSFEESLKMVNRSQHCLMVLSVTNVFNKAFEVSLDSTESIPGTSRHIGSMRAPSTDFRAQMINLSLSVDA